MKTKTFIICIIFIILSTTLVQATTKPTISLKSNSSSVKPGDTFTVTIHGICSEGINGFSTNYSYDTKNLELVSATVSDSSKFSNLGMQSEIAVISNTTSKITDTNLFILTFKVKDNATLNDKSNIKLSNIVLDSDKQTDSKVNINDQEIFITIEKETKPSIDNDKKDDNIPNSSNDENDKKQPDTNIKNSEDANNDKSTNKLVVTSNFNNVKDASKASSKIPYAGSNMTIILVLIAVVAVVVIFYILYRKYKDII